MPCYDPRDTYRNNSTELDMIKNLNEKVNQLEASLCALITELEKRGIANEVISNASKKGLIDLMKFWQNHSKEDESRIAYRLHQFSEHEQEIIKKLLKL